MTSHCKRMAEVWGSFGRPFLLTSAQPVPMSLHILVNKSETNPKVPAVAHRGLLQIRIKPCQGAFRLFGYFSWVLFVYLEFFTHSYKYFEL